MEQGNSVGASAFFHPAKGHNPEPFEHNTEVTRFLGCPDCGGRGWFLIEPFRTGGSGAGGYSNMCKCLNCERVKAHVDKYGVMPKELSMAQAPAAVAGAEAATKSGTDD